jgi:hypothetical protein
MSSGSSVWPPTSPPNLCGTTHQLGAVACPRSIRPTIYALAFIRASTERHGGVLLRVLARGPGTLSRASRALRSRQERQLTAPRYQIGPPTPERPGTVPSHPPSPLPRGGTLHAAAATGGEPQNAKRVPDLSQHRLYRVESDIR